MFKKIKNFSYLIIFLIFSLGIFLRFFELNKFPVGFHIDEAILGYTGYSLLLTGKDTNNLNSLYTEVFGDYIPIGYHYLTTIPIKLFGLTEFSTRLPGAFLGGLTILAVLLLSQTIFQNKKISILSTFLFSISPWHVILSRGSSEAVASLFFIVSGFAIILYGLKKENVKFLSIGTLLLILSFFFYHASRLFVPTLYLSLIVLFSFFWKFKKNNFRIYFLTSFLFCSLISFLLIFVISGGSSRFSQVSIFGFPETRLIMEEEIREDGIENTNILVTRFFHNKIVNYSETFVANYFEYFTANFLFLKGGLPLMFNIPQMGLVYSIEIFFLIIGSFFLLKNGNILYKIPLIWLLLAPVAGALTVDDIPNVRRAIIMVPAIEIIVAFGIYSFINYSFIERIKKVVIPILVLLFIFNFTYFLHQYFVHSKVHKTWYRNNGFKSVMSFVEKSYHKYDKVIVTKSTGGVYPLVLFYMKMDPQIYQNAGSPKDREYSGFGKFFFVPQECPSVDKDDRFPKGRFIYIDNGTCSGNDDERKKDFVAKEDGTTAFRVVYD